VIEDEESSMAKRTFVEGDCFGEAAMLSLINNTASFIAADDSDLVVFSRKAFNRLRKEDPTIFSQLILNLARELARKLQYSDELMLHPKK
jgi:CRP-like cAMP-binding protein